MFVLNSYLQQDWVCDDAWKPYMIISLFWLGNTIGAWVLGIMGDMYVFFINSFLICIVININIYELLIYILINKIKNVPYPIKNSCILLMSFLNNFTINSKQMNFYITMIISKTIFSQNLLVKADLTFR